MDRLEAKFHNDLADKMFRARKECKYKPTRFNQMLALYGGVETAKRLIRNSIYTGKPSEGLSILLSAGRADLTMEDSVCDPQYAGLFSAEEIAHC